MTSNKSTYAVSNDVFRAVYDSPASLPGKHKWTTPDEDVRQLEGLLGMPQKTIGAPLWLSGDRQDCEKCSRRMSWLDIVSSALGGVHGQRMIAEVMLGKQKYVNTEAPRSIAGVKCYKCGTAFDGLTSFKCHNWEYAFGDMKRIIESMAAEKR
jgi:hypothetical protein